MVFLIGRSCGLIKRVSEYLCFRRDSLSGIFESDAVFSWRRLVTSVASFDTHVRDSRHRRITHIPNEPVHSLAFRQEGLRTRGAIPSLRLFICFGSKGANDGAGRVFDLHRDFVSLLQLGQLVIDHDSRGWVYAPESVRTGELVFSRVQLAGRIR